MVNGHKVALLVMLFWVLWGGTAFAESVEDAILAALKHHPQIEAARAATDVAKADRMRAFGQFLPSITASVDYSDGEWRSSNLNTLQGEDGITYGLSASQPIFQGGTALNGYKESQSQLKSKQFLVQDAIQRIALAAAAAHASITLQREIMQHRDESAQLVNEQFMIAKKRMQAGAESLIGVSQARVRMQQERVELERARGNLGAAEAAYERATGYIAPQEVIADNIQIANNYANRDDALAAGLFANPLLNSARESVNAARSGRRTALGQLAPKLSLEANYFIYDADSVGASIFSQSRENEFQVVAKLLVPIFQQGQNYAGIRSSAAQLAVEKANLRDVRLSVEESISRSWRQLEAAESRRNAAREAVAAAEVVVTGRNAEYEAGQSNILDVLDGQRDLVLARVSLSQADFDYRSSRYELLAATARLASPVKGRQDLPN